jgi:hypothetical protein
VTTTTPTFNTAVFVDIENVLGGYDNDALATVSISEIMDVIREEGGNAGLISSIAVNRAYANWSIARLSVLRREIVEQGIEPKQIFGFDRGEKKNAADPEQEPRHPRVVLRNAVPQGLTMLPDRDARVLYKTVLERDLPRLFIPEPEQLHQLVGVLIADPPTDEPLAEMIERVGERLQGLLDTEHVKFSLGAFVGAEAFDRSPPNERLINQTLTLKSSMRSEDTLLAALRRAVETKLIRVLGSVDARTVDSMFARPPN